MPCVGLPVKPQVTHQASADNIIVLDENGRPYSLSNLLACGRKMYFRVHITWQNCNVINLRLTCGDHGTARLLINTNVRLPRPSGTGWVEIKGQNGRLFDVTEILSHCGYSCTSRQVFFCTFVKCIG